MISYNKSQHNLSNIYKQDGCDPVTIAVLPSQMIVEMEPGMKYISVWGTPTGKEEYDSRQVVQNCVRQMWLDA